MRGINMDTFIEELKKVIYKDVLPMLITTVANGLITALANNMSNNSKAPQNYVKLTGDGSKITRVDFYGPIFKKMDSDSLNKLANETISAYKA